jgi:hypothetical protein
MSNNLTRYFLCLTCDKSSIPNSLVHLRNHGGAGDSSAEEEDDSEDDAWCHKHCVAGVLLAVDGRVELDWHLAVFSVQVAVVQKVSEERFV